jgi:hypothetical protein
MSGSVVTMHAHSRNFVLIAWVCRLLHCLHRSAQAAARALRRGRSSNAVRGSLEDLAIELAQATAAGAAAAAARAASAGRARPRSASAAATIAAAAAAAAARAASAASAAAEAAVSPRRAASPVGRRANSSLGKHISRFTCDEVSDTAPHWRTEGSTRGSLAVETGHLCPGRRVEPSAPPKRRPPLACAASRCW